MLCPFTTPSVSDFTLLTYDDCDSSDLIGYDHMPYLPFPPTWPVYIPGKKLANWLESYASILEIPVWLSTNVLSVSCKDTESAEWIVDVDRPEGRRSLKPKHVVFAIGWGGKPSIPTYPGLEDFKGEVMHSSAYKTAKNHAGKKVIVIGASTSGWWPSLNQVSLC
jgi:cation diffusion facilitator CzcD-associated flavoprotein CzcO